MCRSLLYNMVVQEMWMVVGVPELEGEFCRSLLLLEVELALSVLTPTVSSAFMMQTL